MSRDTRFKPGQSGNPKGRPKGTRNFANDLEDVLEKKVRIMEDGRSNSVSSQMAALMRLREKALKGDGRALDRIIAMASEHSAEKEARSADRQLSADENAILERYQESILRGARLDDASAKESGNAE